MPNRCVVAGCNNMPNVDEHIAIHAIPFYGDNRREAKKRRRKWVNFVKSKRGQWEPTKHSVICSKHFNKDDFVRVFSVEGEKVPRMIPKLKTDDFGVNVYPTIHSIIEKPIYDRKRNLNEMIKSAKEQIILSGIGDSYHNPVASKSIDDKKASAYIGGIDTVIDPNSVEETCESCCGKSDPCGNKPTEGNEQQTEVDGSEPTEVKESTCANYVLLESENRQLRNKVKSLREKLHKRQNEQKKTNRSVERLQKQLESLHQDTHTVGKEADPEEELQDNDHSENSDEIHETDSLCETIVGENEMTTETEDESDNESVPQGPSLTGTNLRTEPKYIAFLSQLLFLFKFCHVCKTDNPTLKTRQIGTAAVITTICTNPKCNKVSTWNSQPLMPNSKIPAGNFLLCMAILVAGGSATKLLRIFSNMGLACMSLNTYFKYQKNKLFPTIVMYWQNYQKKMLQKMKTVQGGVIIAGDGRFDSMGHSAKFGAYTIFCCTLPMIVHFALVQRNQAGNSPAMEFMGFHQCIEHLLGCGILINTFISDRHTTIANHMKTVLKKIIHYFDLWHLKKKIRKVLTKISKESGCEVLTEWIKPCQNHLHWSASSTFSGNGRVIWAKFKSFLSHVTNKHSNLDDPLFNRCAHEQIQPRKWLHADSIAYEKLCNVLTKPALKKGIMQASPHKQTSCIEGFHSVLNQFSPKMICYSYAGMYCRHILAAVHFNFNLQRDVKCREHDGIERLHLSYPKFKNGEATVRNVTVAQNFDYVQEIYNTYISATEKELEATKVKLKEMTPPAMHSMLDKQSRSDAIEKKAKRNRLTVEDIPPTTPVHMVPETQTRKRKKQPTERSKPTCSECKRPMKGHKNVIDCPKNKSKANA